MKKLQQTAILLILIGLVGYTIYDKTRHDPKPIVPEKAYESETLLIDLPQSIEFCSEKVPMKELAVREKLDKDLHANTFFHSNTILIIKRANRWFPQMRPILKKNGIPEDFLYLAVIESNLQNLISPAGAVGFWQFMEPTAKEMGLEVNKYVDERYHPIKATKAACKYLKKAYRRFGNWTLVAASYNMGMRGLERQMERQKADSYYELALNSETARYVYRILAMKEIMERPHKYNFKIPPRNLYWQPKTRTVEVTETINDLAAFAEENGISYGSLKYHNPWLRTDKLKVKKGDSYQIELPLEGPTNTYAHEKRLDQKAAGTLGSQ